MSVRIAAESDGVTVGYEVTEKPSPCPVELAVTERLLTLRRKPDPELPGQSVVEDEAVTDELSVSTPETIE